MTSDALRGSDCHDDHQCVRGRQRPSTRARRWRTSPARPTSRARPSPASRTGASNVDAETRERVLAAMRKLGYRPNSAARALRSGRFHSIGVIMFTLSSFGNMRTLDAIASAATDAGYSITLIPVPHPTRGEVSVAFDRLSEEAVDGVIIVVEAHLLDESDVELPAGLPVVVDRLHGERPLPRRRHRPGARREARDRAPARARTPHGVARRRTRALVLGRGPARLVGGDAARRMAPRCRPCSSATGRASPGHELGLELARNPDVTAIFAANDQMALGVLRALHEVGSRGARRGQRRRLRRHGGVAQLLAAAHDGAPVLRRGRLAIGRGAPARGRGRRAAAAARSSTPSCRARQHGAPVGLSLTDAPCAPRSRHPNGIAPTTTPTPSITSETMAARHSTFLW